MILHIFFCFDVKGRLRHWLQSNLEPAENGVLLKAALWERLQKAFPTERKDVVFLHMPQIFASLGWKHKTVSANKKRKLAGVQFIQSNN